MIQLAELKAHLGTSTTSGDPDADTVLVSLEERAVSFVERETGRHFGPVETRVEFHEGTGTARLWLQEEPEAVASVEYRAAVGEAWTEIEAAGVDGWELRGDRLLRKACAVWETCYEYRVTYDFGYAVGAEPSEVRGLVIDLVTMRWRQRGLEGRASGRDGDFGFTLSDIHAIHGADKILRRWRHPVVG